MLLTQNHQNYFVLVETSACRKLARSFETQCRLLESQEKKSKISARTLEQCGLENSKNTKNSFLVRVKN